MGKFFGSEIKKTPVKITNTVVQLPSGSFLKLGGQGYNITQTLQVDLTVSGLGGVESVSVVPSNGVMFLFVVRSGGVNYLTASANNVSIYSASSFVGFIQVNNSFVFDTFDHAEGYVSSAWQNYIPIFDGFTPSNLVTKFRQDGSDLLVSGWVTINSATGSSLSIYLPDGLLGDFNRLPEPTDRRNKVGTLTRIEGGQRHYNQGGILHIEQGNPNKVFYGTLPSFSTVFDNNSANDIANGNGISFEFRVPILGWTDNLQKLLG